MAQTNDRSFAVIGLGIFGSTVASELARFGNHVLGIDTDEKNVSQLADTLAEAIIADGRDEVALREAGVGNYDVAVVAIGEDLESNILCTMNIKLLGVSTVWVKAMSRTHSDKARSRQSHPARTGSWPAYRPDAAQSAGPRLR